jgi:aminoglycoside/choline kinase family phosphotransferase
MSETRADQIELFLNAAGWAGAKRAPLAGDASNRRYERLNDGPDGQGAVLMDAPPERGEDVRPFLHIARHLTGLGLSAPRILAAEPDHGFLLLEDLGDDLFSRVAATDPGVQQEIYTAAVDALVELHRHPPPANIPDYGPGPMTTLAGLAFVWYARGGTDRDKETFSAELETVLSRHTTASPVLALRDYHAENLLWLPARAGLARVGLLDFQDGALGHPAYDLISLTEDARRDVPPDLAEAMLEHYIAATGQAPGAFRAAAAAIAAQRNLRILGVFARLSLHYGKPGYIDLIPRVWDHLMRDLAHPDLGRLRDIVQTGLPKPTPDILAELKAKCGTVPTL